MMGAIDLPFCTASAPLFLQSVKTISVRFGGRTGGQKSSCTSITASAASVASEAMVVTQLKLIRKLYSDFEVFGE